MPCLSFIISSRGLVSEDRGLVSEDNLQEPILHKHFGGLTLDLEHYLQGLMWSRYIQCPLSPLLFVFEVS